MKKVLFCLFLIASVGLADDPRYVDVGPTNTLVVPARTPNLLSAPAWVTNFVYNPGSYMTSSGRFYVVISATNTAVTLSHGPVHVQGEVTTNGVVLLNVPKQQRVMCALRNEGTGTLHFSLGKATAVTNGPLGLAAGGTSSSLPGVSDILLQYQLNAISNDGVTNRLWIQEL